jgi:hypothetical protein
MQYGTDLWAADRVSIARISPEDAPSLIDERQPHGRRKLAGDRFGNFAAFIDELWRRNDMMWGRLDAAERLIRTLLPAEHPDFDAMRDEALYEVLREELRPADRDELCGLLAQAVLSHADTPTIEEVQRLLRDEFGNAVGHRIRAILRFGLSEHAMHEYIRTSYEVDRSTSAPRAMSALTRAIRIVGRMLEQTADRAGLDGRPLGWMARLGHVGWWFVEIATPGTLEGLEAGHLWVLSVLIALTLYIGGGLSHARDVSAVGRNGLLVLGGLLFLWLAFRAVLASRTSHLKKFAISLVGGLALLGAWAVIVFFNLAGSWLPSWARTPDFDLFLALPAAAAAVYVSLRIRNSIRPE